jgi:hypothetical protein
MKKIILFLLFPLSLLAQNTPKSDASLITQAQVIYNETNPGGNTKQRIANMHMAEVASKMNFRYGVESAGTNSYIIVPNNTPSSYLDGHWFLVKILNGNTGASTLQIAPLAAIAIEDDEGAAIVSGRLKAGAYYLFAYNTTFSSFQIVGGSGTATLQDLQSVFDEGSTATIITPVTIETSDVIDFTSIAHHYSIINGTVDTDILIDDSGVNYNVTDPIGGVDNMRLSITPISTSIGESDAGVTASRSVTGTRIFNTSNDLFLIRGSVERVKIDDNNNDYLVNTTGSHRFLGNATKAAEIQLLEDSDNGSNYIGLIAPSSLAGNTSYTLPTAYPAVNGYVLSSLTDGTMSWIAQSGGSGAWGTITGTLADQTDLQTALDGKINDTGNETIAGIKTFSSTIVGSINGNAATVTTNANLTGDVTSTGNSTNIATGVIVNADINASAAISATKLIDGSITDTELGYINTLSSNAQTQIDGKQPLDSDLTSWAAITRASGFDTWATTPSSANFRSTLTDEIGTGLVVTAPSGSTANQILRKNSGNTDTEWASTATGAAVTVTSGSNLHFTTGGNISTGAVNAFSIGGNAYVSTVVTTTVTLSSAYEVVHATSSGGSYTITLPAIASAGTDKIYIIIKETAANTITIDGDGSETVVGATTFAMTDLNQTLIIQAQAGGWMPINLNYSGTYTPTLTNSANLTASTARLCTFSRIGNSVTVAGQVDIDPTTTLTLTTLGISLPIASNFTTAFQAGGASAAIDVSDGSAGIQSDATNDRVTFQYVCTDVTNHTMTFTFTYQIL